MPISAYLKAGLFVIAAGAALFAAAGTVAIPGFWAYLAIFAVVMIVSFVVLDPDLLRERMRPGGKKPPLSLRVVSLVLFFSLPFLLHRAITEDRILQVELAGYSDYAARVRWRLVPGIW